MSRLPAAQRREQLLDTAARVFAVHGYSGATTAELARAAGVTEPIIYRHFASKRELFIALVERTGNDTLRLWEHELRSAPNPAERLRRLLGANPMVSTRGRELYRVIIQAMTESEDQQIRQAINEHISRLHAFLTSEVRAAQESGSVSKRFSPAITAWALINMGMGYGLLAQLAIENHGVDESGLRMQDMLAQLMLGNPKPKGEGG